MLVLLSGLATAGVPTDLPVPCGTPERFAAVVEPRWPDFPPPPGDLGLRDAYGVFEVQTSEHFAVRWGPNNPPSAEQRQALLDAFEDTWDFQIGGMAHTAPYGTDAFHFNVYVGDTGGGTPTTGRAAGYYSTDPDGWPVIVVGRSVLDNPDFARITVAHEFYHAIQGATDRFNYDPGGPSAWLWEATATAASHEVYPDNPSYASFLFGYAYHRHLGLDFFDYPNQGVTTEYYQYGAFIFPLHVADRLGSWQVIRDVWEDPGSNADPIEVMRDRLAQEGVGFDELWMDHLARNATWDYPDKQIYKQILNEYRYLEESKYYDPFDLPVRGRDGWSDGPLNQQPARYGSNHLVIIRPLEGEYSVDIEADEIGDRGTPRRMAVTAVLEDADGVTYEPVDCEDSRCSVTYDDIDDLRRLHLVVGTWSDERPDAWRSETFPYRWRLSFEAPPIDEVEPEPRGCNCSASGAGGSAAWLALLVLPWWRRRR